MAINQSVTRDNFSNLFWRRLTLWFFKRFKIPTLPTDSLGFDFLEVDLFFGTDFLEDSDFFKLEFDFFKLELDFFISSPDYTCLQTMIELRFRNHPHSH